MGQPVVHFEVMGKDADKLRSFFTALFGWSFDTNNPMNYGMVERNVNPEGIGIGGGVGAMPEDFPGYVTFYVEVPDVEAALVEAERLGATRLMGPEKVAEGVEIGMFSDPEGHPIGVTRSAS
jgi:predicted enzyme related to lactoylglutathione lyase